MNDLLPENSESSTFFVFLPYLYKLYLYIQPPTDHLLIKTSLIDVQL